MNFMLSQAKAARWGNFFHLLFQNFAILFTSAKGEKSNFLLTDSLVDMHLRRRQLKHTYINAIDNSVTGLQMLD